MEVPKVCLTSIGKEPEEIDISGCIYLSGWDHPQGYLEDQNEQLLGVQMQPTSGAYPLEYFAHIGLSDRMQSVAKLSRTGSLHIVRGAPRWIRDRRSGGMSPLPSVLLV